MRTIILAASACLGLMILPAHAITRVWISGKGVDQPNCGPIASPCRTLQFAHNLVDAGGEIDVLDGAGYGSLVITKGVAIINDGAGVAGVLAAPGGAAITINAGPTDEIRLRGLAIQGVSTGSVGIQFNTGAALGMINTSVSGFTATGINFAPTGNGGNVFLGLQDCEIFNNTSDAITVRPTGSLQTRSAIWRTLVAKSTNGITVDNSANSSGFALMTISDSLIRNMSGNGVVAATTNNSSSHIEIDRSTLTFIGTVFSVSGSNAIVILQSNAITSNPTVTAITNGGSVRSFGNNAISFFQNAPSLTTIGLQ